MMVAELAYRLISPKTVVATTGPIYLSEVVSLLLLGVVDGLCRLRQRVSWDGAALHVAAPQLTAAVLLGRVLHVLAGPVAHAAPERGCSRDAAACARAGRRDACLGVRRCVGEPGEPALLGVFP
jgi:hypothetical protein